MQLNYERQYLPEESLDIAMQTLVMLDLRAEFRNIGDKLKTYHCKLIDDKNKHVFFGCGKGLGLQSKASAFYEALEHYFIHRFCQDEGDDAANYHPVNDADINKKLSESGVLPDNFLGNHAAKIPFTCMAETGNNHKLHYPIFLLDPRYAKRPSELDGFCYEPLAWFASDSGTASGTSYLEASIHALNELIERDAYSLFLINAFICNDSKKVRLIDKSTIPERLRKIVTEIETTYSDDLMIFDVTSDIGVPTVFVSMTRQTHLFQPRGCGTSLNREYALERALLESLQPLHIYNDELIANQQAIITNYQQAPLLLKCAKADVSALVERCKVVNFDSLPCYDPAYSLEQQCELITDLIKKQGFQIYHKKIAELQTGFTCVKYLVPKFEQFYMVQTGKFILPNTRGLALLSKD